jgi:predicted acylesterase/phospholipase RssA
MPPVKLRAATAIVCGLVLAGCVTAPRLETPPLGSRAAAPEGFAPDIRTDALDYDFYEAHAEQTTGAVKAASDGSIDILALSGGGAGGAFGAGVLVGLTNADARPRFELVTGVSTGALIAPFAFLGPDWDGKLTEAYRSGATDGLLRSRGAGALFATGVYEGEPLRRLVERFVTDELVAAVADQAVTGRMLLVATTNLDREETVIWNMGAIAVRSRNSEADKNRARELFRDVLVASSSAPGVFPPVMIKVSDGQKTYDEMHVDGGATTPFFIVPDIAMIMGYAPKALHGANVFVIINGQASSPPRATQNNTVDIAARSFTAVLNHMTRSELAQTNAFASRNGMAFHYTTIPPSVEFGGSLAFDQANMRAIFDYGMRCATRGHAWMTPEQALAHTAMTQSVQLSPDRADCPLRDG